MTPEIRTTAIELLALPAAAFFTLDDTVTTALQTRLAMLLQPPPQPRPPVGERTALPEFRAIGVPDHIDWRHNNSFPLLVSEVRSNRRAWEVDPLQNRLAIVSNLRNGAVELTSMDTGRRTAVRPPSGTGTPPDPFDAILSSIGVRRFDLLRWFPRQRMDGPLAITMLDYDLPSNTAVVRAGSGVGAPSEAVLAGAESRLTARPVPATAIQPGVGLDVLGAVSRLSPGTVRASISLPRAHVTAVDAPPGESHALTLAATLVLVRLDDANPVLLHLAIPGSVGGGNRVEAAFNLDLRPVLGARVAAGNWLVYLVAGDTVTGPRPLRIESR